MMPLSPANNLAFLHLVSCKTMMVKEVTPLHNILFSGALAVELESSGPNQHIVQFVGKNEGVLVFGTDVESCGSAAGIVCQGLSCISFFTFHRSTNCYEVYTFIAYPFLMHRSCCNSRG